MRKLEMKTRLLWLTLFWTSAIGQAQDVTSSQQAEGMPQEAGTVENQCLVCGEDGEIDNSSRIVTTTLGLFTCGGLAGAGFHGNIPAGQCSVAQSAASEKCGCIVGEQVFYGGDDHLSHCHICPNEGVVTIPEGVVVMPDGTPDRTCGEYLASAVNGELRLEQCTVLQDFTNETCGCTKSEEIENVNRPSTSNETFVCPVCGEGKTAADPNALVTIPTAGDRTCGEIEGATAKGKIAAGQCQIISSLVQLYCDCQVGEWIEPALTMPTGAYDCHICGDGNVVTIPDAVVTVPTQPDRTCQELLHANSIGNMNRNQCTLLQPFVTNPCGCTLMSDTDKPTAMPTDAPTSSPTAPIEPTISPAPTGWATQRLGCFDSLTEIYEVEKDVEDASVWRKYTLCPGTTFQLGTMDDFGHIKKGDVPLMIRPNVMYQCGEKGDRRDNCILKGGDFGLTSFYGVFDGIYETVENVRIQGVTFQDQSLLAAAMEAAGDIEFTDCVFKDQGNLAPVLMQWRGGGPEVPIESTRERKLRSSTRHLAAQGFKQRMLQQEPPPTIVEQDFRKLQQDSVGGVGAGGVDAMEYKQVVTFRNCVFRDNYVTDTMGFPGVIENSFGSTLNIINCIFEDNVYGRVNNPAPVGHAIRSFGPLYIESSCFLDNVFLGHGPVSVYGAPHTTSRNHVRSFQEDLRCEFLAVFSTLDDTADDLPICFNSDAEICAVDRLPTMAPTPGAPTAPPAPRPTVQEEDDTEVSSSTSSSNQNSAGSSSIHGQMATCVLSVVVALGFLL